jgi:hypothetical protein
MTKAAADQMFAAAGRGTMNVVDWFDDNSHGHIEVQRQARRRHLRSKIIDLGRAAAAAAMIDLSEFTVVVAVTNVGVDVNLFVSPHLLPTLVELCLDRPVVSAYRPATKRGNYV